MPNFKLTIEYDGTNFCGWQIQRKGERTVQAELKHALEKIFKAPIVLIGAGRTDSGVHASGQVAHFKTDSIMTPDVLLRALNANLPSDIAILKVQRVSDHFHAQFLAKSKIYRYIILNRQARSARARGFCVHIPWRLNQALMKKESKVLLGRHDFSAFTASNPHCPKNNDKQKNIRTIKRISFSFAKDGFLFIDIEANGFLYKMVRNIIGTLIEIGRGSIPPGGLRKILASKVRRNAGPTAPPQGLTLFKVKY